ncbi:MAG: NAD(P)H-dependent oxidoreductase [Desulfovibrio sp.]|nr:NAD(P)H-dependent oxidoreductase [Desulfovibrio sp.]
MSKTLVISGHPDYKSSVANRAILDDLHRLLPAAEIVYLDALYPDFRIDVRREQERLPDADVLVFEFPFWWYGSPSLMHRYVEDVFTHGFAYGSQGHALAGKKFILSFTTGAPEAAYSPTGAQGYAIEAFLPSFLAMAKLTKLDYAGFVASYGMALVDKEDKKARDAVIAKAGEHAKKLVALIRGQ